MAKPTKQQILTIWKRHLRVKPAAEELGWSWAKMQRWLDAHGIERDKSPLKERDLHHHKDWTEAESTGDALADKLVAFLQSLPKGAEISLIDAANAMDCAPNAVEVAAEIARSRGFAVNFSDLTVSLDRIPDHERRSFAHDFYGEHFKVGIFGDTQYGSRYAAENEADEFFAFCRKEKVQALYHTGDVTDGNGVYPGHIRELRPDCLTADAQAERAAQAFVGAGLPIYFILGNHDLKWYRDIGFDVGLKIEDRAIQLGAKHEIKCLGHEDARVRLGAKTMPCLLDILHPSGGTPYAISYRSQKIIADLEGGDKPHIIAIGHLHKAEDLPHIRNVVALQPGCFQWQTPFMRKKPTPAHVAGCVIEGWMTRLRASDSKANDRSESGAPTLTRLKYEWLKFYAPEREPVG